MILAKQDNDSIPVAKLKKIIARQGLLPNKDWPTIDVQYYFPKAKLNRGKNYIDCSLYDNLANNEVFETEKIERVYYNNIAGKCSLYSLEEYNKCNDPNNGLDCFTRGVCYNI